MPHPSAPTTVSRRHSIAALLAAGSAPRVWAQATTPGPGGQTRGRLVLVLLRGACDGLSVLVPYADADYHAVRPNIAIPTPNGTAQTALKLDSTFALHPALAPLLPLWQQGALAFVPAAGLPAPNRSHFDAQLQIETSRRSAGDEVSGWLNRLAGIRAGQSAALGVGEANPVILAGPASVKLIGSGRAAVRTGVLANDRTRQTLLDLYAGDDAIGQAFRQGATSRMQSARELSTEKAVLDSRRQMAMLESQRQAGRALDADGTPPGTAAQIAQMLAASNGAADAVGLQLDAQHLGTLMRNDRSLALGFLSAGGWDTHANQGQVTGQLANNLANLARGLVQLRQDFSEPGDVIVVMSEFGRTAAENGTRGTDHGWGNAMWLIGSRVHGGRWHGRWPGLAPTALNESRELAAQHDYRAVLAQVIRASLGLSDSALADVFPGARWDASLDGLLRPT